MTQDQKEPVRRGRAPLLTLFFSTLYISAFTFGGGFVIVTFMKRRFVDELKWLDETEMLDYTALAQSCPGAIAVNAAILVGWKVGGFPGMLTAVLGTILPPMAILSLISLFYAAFASSLLISLLLKGMQAGVAAVILSVAWDLGANVLREHSVIPVMIMAAAFLLDVLFSVNVVLIILGAAAAGLVRFLLQTARERRVRS